jgi:signal transduction histidine kinase
VHRIVSDYAGRIDVVSAPGAGTTVEVRLPGRLELAAV